MLTEEILTMSVSFNRAEALPLSRTTAFFTTAPFVLTFFLIAAPNLVAQVQTGAVRWDGPAGTPCGTKEGLPCDRTPQHLAGLSDPAFWSVANSGPKQTLFRRATRNELAVNRWPVGSFLVDATSAFEATKGAKQVNLVIPISDDRTQTVVLVLQHRTGDLEFIERSGVPNSPNGEIQTRVLRPTLYEYFNQGFNPRRPSPVKGAWATMVAGSDGGFFASGLAAGFEFEAGGPGPLKLDPVPAPPGLAPNPKGIVAVKIMSLGTFGGTQYNNCQGNFASPACNWFCTEMIGVPCDNNPHLDPPPAANCVDHLDNDGDTKTDSGDEECKSQPQYGDDLHPGFPRRDWESGKSFALFGEGRFCTSYATAGEFAGNWIQRLTAMGWKAEELMNSAIGFQGVLPREKQVRYRAGGCWIFPSFEAAAACNASGSQCLSGYPYANSGSTSSNYYGRVWDDVHHAMFIGLKDALHMAQTVHWGGTDVALGCNDGTDVCCGASLTPLAGPDGQGSGVIQYEYTAGAAFCSIAGAGPVTAHEFGHMTGLEHNDNQNFMHSPAWNGSVLPAADKNLLVGCMTDWDCPRPSGFRWINPMP
jgi:hypothetical protein